MRDVKAIRSMSKVVLELSMSLDGFVAGPNDNPDNSLGEGGAALSKRYCDECR